MLQLNFTKYNANNYSVSQHGQLFGNIDKLNLFITFNTNVKDSLKLIIWYFFILTGKKAAIIKNSRIRSAEKQTLVGIKLSLTGSEVICFLNKVANFIVPNQEIDQLFTLQSNTTSLSFKKCLTYTELDLVLKALVKFNLIISFKFNDFKKQKNLLQMLRIPVK